MEDMWHDLFSMRGDQVKEARTNFSKCSEYYLVYGM
jgi:hypothetical protein